jgi:pimeloyl-ACP methyl ester carboxylesterase
MASARHEEAVMNRVGAGRVAVAAMLILAATGAVATPAEASAPARSAAACQNDFGSKTPVLLVHGFHEGTDVWESMTKTIQASLPDVKVVAPFDYPNTEWVNDPNVGPKLASVIRCLATSSKNNGGPGKVIIVAHSMGGLAVRCAVDLTCAGTDAVNQQQIGLVITLGTPNAGSLLAAAGNGLSTANAIACEAIHALQTGFNLPCPDLSGWLFGANSPAAQAMAIGLDGKPSQDLSALQPLPSKIPLDAIAGQVTVNTTLFDLGPFTVSAPQFDLGDLVVPVASAEDGAPPTSPAHPGTNTPHPGAGSGTATISCGSITISNLVGPKPASASSHVTCWHMTETTDQTWQAQVIAAIKSAASALSLSINAPCTQSAVTDAVAPSMNAPQEDGVQWNVSAYACKDGYSMVDIHVNQGLDLVAILKQQGPSWKPVYGPTEGLCIEPVDLAFCPGHKLPLPLAVLQSLEAAIAGSTTTTKAELYINTPFTPGALYTYPSGPPSIGIDNHDSITNIQWTAGSQDDLIGTGTLHYDNCNPDCASGSLGTAPVQITASNPQQCAVQLYPNGLGSPSQTVQAEVFSQIDVQALQGNPPSSLVGDAVLPKPCA